MRWVGVLLLLVLVCGRVDAGQEVVKNPDGTTIAVIYDCSSCKNAAGKGCADGVEEGFHDGKPCGKCMLDANFGARIGYAYDILVGGRVKDPQGKPVANKFVKLSLPNTWSYRTRSLDDGFFRLMLGATLDRKGDPVKVDLGTRTVSPDAKGDYMLFMLPAGHKPCKAETD